MKRIVAILLFLTMVLSLKGCVTVKRASDRTPLPASTETTETGRTPSAVTSPISEPEAVNESDAYELPEATPEPEPESQFGYAVTADLIFEIAGGIQNIISEMTNPDEPRESAGFGDPVKGSYRVFASSSLMDTRELSEDQASMDRAPSQWKERMRADDTQLFHGAPHDYRLTGTWALSDDEFEIQCRYDTDTGALQVLRNQNGMLMEGLEFKPLGDDRYALQYRIIPNGYEKAIATYRDGEILNFQYASFFRDKAYRSIYPDGQGLDEAWFKEDGSKNYLMELIYDGSTLTYNLYG